MEEMCSMMNILLTCMFVVVATLAMDVGSKEKLIYLSFVQEWPESTCIFFRVTKTTTDCDVPKAAKPWLIHGLWLEEGRSYPENCNSSKKFNETEILGLTPELERYWPTLVKTKTSEEFWRHEWKAHGRCATRVRLTGNEYKYFAETLNLRKEHDVLRMLAKAGIKPAANITYPMKSISHAINKSFGYIPYMECVKSKRADYLMRIYLCFDANLKPMNCPLWKFNLVSGINLQCGKIVHYPPIETARM